MGITLEVISLLIVLVLALYHADSQQRSIRRYQLFTMCLILSALTIFLNIVSSVAINYAASLPMWLSNALSNPRNTREVHDALVQEYAQLIAAMAILTDMRREK